MKLLQRNRRVEGKLRLGCVLQGKDVVSRIQISAFLSTLAVGANIRVDWRVAATLDSQSSTPVTWYGSIKSIDPMIARWNVGCPGLDDGGELPLPFDIGMQRSS